MQFQPGSAIGGDGIEFISSAYRWTPESLARQLTGVRVAVGDSKAGDVGSGRWGAGNRNPHSMATSRLVLETEPAGSGRGEDGAMGL